MLDFGRERVIIRLMGLSKATLMILAQPRGYHQGEKGLYERAKQRAFEVSEEG